MSDPYRDWRAGLLAAVYASFLILGFPGLNSVGDNDEGDASGGAGAARPILAFNHYVRAPLAKILDPLQRPFRISQQWNLYTSGPGEVHRMQIELDGQPVYRSVDPTLTWMEPQLRYRRVRPMVEATAGLEHPTNWKGLCRLVVGFAERDYPDTKTVEIVFLGGPFPGTDLEEEKEIVAVAPDFNPEMRSLK